MRTASLVAVVLLLTLSHSGSATTSWPGFRGPSFDGSGSLGRPWPERPAVARDWLQPLGSGYSGVVVAGDRAFTAWSEGGEDWIGAFETGSGARLWKRSLGPTYAGHDGSHDGPIATPTLIGNRLVFLTPRGRLAALAAGDGSPLWQVELNAETGSEPPHYGVSASPLAIDLDGDNDLVVVEHRVAGSHAVAAYDVATGERRWKAGDDVINYQSPVLATLAGRRQILAAGDKLLVGLDPATGTQLWSYAHGGEEGDMAAGKIVPLPLGDDRIFIAHSVGDSQLLKLAARDGGLTPEKMWNSPALGRSYAPAVHLGGLLVGYSGTILVGVDAATGERRWRSREPGDGFLLRVDDRLAVLTKKGTFHLGRVDASGWVEDARLPLFETYAWTPPSIAGGQIFARSLGQVARASIVAAATTTTTAVAAKPATEGFEGFLATLATRADKQAAVDAYFASLPPGPVIEGERVHFVYRGSAEDLGILGDMLGSRVQEPMRRIADTDLFVYSTKLPTDALVSYRFVRDYEQQIPDPRGPLQVEERPGRPTSWLAMPGARKVDFLREAPAERRGRLESHEIDDAKFGQKRRIEVWLPPGYDAAKERYPVVYVHGGRAAIDPGLLPTALDNLVGGGRLRPLIAVVVHLVDEQRFSDFGDRRNDYMASVAEQVVPFVDRTYRTLAQREGRASYGAGFPAGVGLDLALNRPETFAAASVQSGFLSIDRVAAPATPTASKTHPLTIHVEWGRFDQHAPQEGWDIRKENARLADDLRQRGLNVKSREVAAGHGWGSWRTRWDLVLGELFTSQTPR